MKQATPTTTHTDDETTIQTMKDDLKQFELARGWSKYHSPRNLAISVAIEAAELMEHFQWGDEDIEKHKGDIADEISDVLSYLIYLADSLDMDVSTAFFNKRVKVEKKYPVSMFNPNTELHGAYEEVKKAYRSGEQGHSDA
jgi:NTP pyrophosphatase (non-canonical NTP hydrolase)